jgi:hypothetical protein
MKEQQLHEEIQQRIIERLDKAFDSFALPYDLIKRLERAGKKEGRSLSNMVETLCREGLLERGE